MNKSETIGALAAALSKAQGEIRGAVKDSENLFFKNKYADLGSVWDACREQLSKNELAVVQTTAGAEGDSFVIETTLMHSSGEWISGELPIKPVKADPQGIGSAITYARRYALAAIVGVAPEDDDAEAATRPAQKSKKADDSDGEKKKVADISEEKTRKAYISKIEKLHKQERDLGQEPAPTSKPLAEMSLSELEKLGKAVAGRVKQLADRRAAEQ